MEQIISTSLNIILCHCVIFSPTYFSTFLPFLLYKGHSVVRYCFETFVSLMPNMHFSPLKDSLSLRLTAYVACICSIYALSTRHSLFSHSIW